MSFITLDRSALIHNLDLISQYTDRKKIAAVLKDNAYGHGLTQMAQMVSEYGVEWAVVRTTKEADLAAKYLNNVLILADLPSQKNSYHYAVNSLADLAKLPKETKVHLKIDSGMHRNGVNPSDLEVALDLIKTNGLSLEGIFSHLKASDELSSELFFQEKNFLGVKERVKKWCLDAGVKTPLFHLYNSAAILRNKNADNYDLVRAGIAIYGYSEMPEVFGKFDLKPVLKLWAEKIASRILKKGERVGYGGAFESESDLVVSTYDVGYADGFFRLDGSSEYLTACGKRLLGKVSMDNMSIESDLDKVCVIDNAHKLAKPKNTISYEVLVRLSPNIERRVI